MLRQEVRFQWNALRSAYNGKFLTHPRCICWTPLYRQPTYKRNNHFLRRFQILCSYPEPETEKERSPLDFPQEWVTPQPSRRPDIFPEFEKLETPLPKPLPGDPEQPDEEEEIEKNKEKPEPEEDPEKEKEEEEDPDQPQLPDA